MVCWGIDVGAKALHGVALDETHTVVACETFDAADPGAVAKRLSGAAVVAIDAPAGLRPAPHRDDPDEALSPKFGAARCAEVALGREHGYWVSWVSPTHDPQPWIQVGL